MNMPKLPLLNQIIETLNLSAEQREQVLNLFRDIESNREFFAIYPSKKAFNSARERATYFHCKAGPLKVWAYRAWSGKSITGGAVYCCGIMDTSEAADLWALLRVGSVRLIIG